MPLVYILSLHAPSLRHHTTTLFTHILFHTFFSYILFSFLVKPTFVEPKLPVKMRSAIILGFLASIALACDNPKSPGHACASAFAASPVEAASFCATYTKSVNTATTGLPPFATACANKPKKLSSACSCLQVPTTLATLVVSTVGKILALNVHQTNLYIRRAPPPLQWLLTTHLLSTQHMFGAPMRELQPRRHTSQPRQHISQPTSRPRRRLLPVLPFQSPQGVRPVR